MEERVSQRKRVALHRDGCLACCEAKQGICPKKKTGKIHLRSLADIYNTYEVQTFKARKVEDPAKGRKQQHKNRKFLSLEEVCRVKRKYDDVNCEKCDGEENEDQILLCDKCDRGFHMYCLCPIVVAVPRGDWFCPVCSRTGPVLEFPKVQKKIVDFFHIRKLPLESSCMEVKKRKRHSGYLTTPKRSRKLVLHIPSKDSERRLEQMASLATALTSARVTFSDKLTYSPGLAPRSSNCASLEKGGMQVMAKDDKATLDLSKSLSSTGQCPPLMVTHDRHEGFVVEADSLIKDMTIIAEYTGDVDFMLNRVHDGGNSMMGLLFTKDPSKELVICPDKRGNIARFVSGINNNSLDGRKKLNVRCVRFDVDGEARVLLVAIRDIPKGERLYYDYNGYQHDYPTEHFL